jgi:hypothetical protein
MTRFVGLLLVGSLVACSSSTGVSTLDYLGRSTVTPTSPHSVQTVVTVRNLGDRVAEINAGTCGIPLEAYDNPSRAGTPAWSMPLPAACPAIAEVVELGPGDSYDLHFSGTLPASLPQGVYYLAVNFRFKVVPAGQFRKVD